MRCKGVNIKISPEIFVIENKSEAYFTKSRGSKTTGSKRKLQ